MVIAYVNETNEAYSVEFKLKSVLECTIYGIFGYTKPSPLNKAITVKTKGIKKILKTEPVDLPVFFNDSTLQITVYNTKYSTGGYLDPLVLTLSCQGKTYCYYTFIYSIIISLLNLLNSSLILSAVLIISINFSYLILFIKLLKVS